MTPDKMTTDYTAEAETTNKINLGFLRSTGTIGTVLQEAVCRQFHRLTA